MDKPSVKERARDELRNYALVAGYLFVCFAVLWFYETNLDPAAPTSWPT